MKINFCTLEGVRYSPKTGKFYKGTTTYEEHEACLTCGEPFLAVAGRPAKVCSRGCRCGALNPLWKGGVSSDREHVLALSRQWKKKNPDRANAHTAARRGKRKGQTPEDYDKKTVQGLFKISQWLTKITGIKHAVDHIHPIKHGGLHCASNLQILTREDNCRKHDKVGIPPCGFTAYHYRHLVLALFLARHLCPELLET